MIGLDVYREYVLEAIGFHLVLEVFGVSRYHDLMPQGTQLGHLCDDEAIRIVEYNWRAPGLWVLVDEQYDASLGSEFSQVSLHCGSGSGSCS